MPVKVNPKITVNKDNTFVIEFSNFYMGFGPAAHINSLTELGSRGHASAMLNADVLDPTHITQGPALSDLTNGTQAGVVDQLILTILEQPSLSGVTSDNVTYGVGTGKLFKIDADTVTLAGTPSWPQTITNMANAVLYEPGIVLLKGNVYIFYNKSSGGDIAKMPISTEVIDPDWGSADPTGKAALQKAPHPSAKKEDIFIFGNGRYVGTYIVADDTLAPTKLDFGNDAVVADVAFHANQWWLAVNYGVTGTNRTNSQILLWDGSAVSSILDDEAAIGLQRIGFLMPIGGLMWCAYQDLSFSGGYKIGYISGRKIHPVGHFTGALPNFAQKTLFKNTILFVSDELLWSCGAVIDDLPIQISQLADGGHAIVGALAAPFGTPMIASTDGSSNHRLAKFSGYDITGNWKSVVVPLIAGRMKGMIDVVIVLTKSLGANAQCYLKLDYNQATSTTTAKNITGTAKRYHYFDSFDFSTPEIEDIRLFLDFSGGNATNDCAIRSVKIMGHFVET